MLEIGMILALLLFSVFLVLGIMALIRNWGRKWVYFSLSVMFMIAAITMVILIKSDLQGISHKQATGTPKNEEKTNNNDIKEYTPPVEELPSEPVEPSPVPQPLEPILPVIPTKPVASDPAKIVVPENSTVNYTVVNSDTLWAISKRAGVSIEKIKQWNGLASDVIRVGQTLKLYGRNIEPLPPNIVPPTTASSVLISHGSTQERQIAFTFDAGSDAVGIAILDILNKHNIKATFFLTGKWVEKFPAYAQRIVNDGHEIGNHTYSHPDSVKISSSAFLQDIIKGEQAIKSATGRLPRPYLRFPYGSYDTNSLKTVGNAGYPLSIQWSLDTIDWQQPSTEVIVSRIESGASNGDIVLMHIGGINTPQAVDIVIPKLKAQGYQLVTLSQLLN